MSEELVDLALRAAEVSGVVYADVRLIAPQRYLSLAVRNGAASALTATLSSGLGIRLRTARAWGFAGTSELTPTSVR
ncbi:MAG: DNA gyrase modulator, partial [Thermoplasmata archaeon]